MDDYLTDLLNFAGFHRFVSQQSPYSFC